MKKLLFTLLLTISAAIAFGQSCITCDENTINFENGASAIGTQNQSTGINSLAVGYQSKALGNYAFTAGYKNNALGDYAIALGKTANAIGDRSIAMGLLSEANGNSSLAIGPYTKTNSSALVSVVFGSRVTAAVQRSMTIGFGLSDNPIENNITNSLMVGFNSNRPTFFVGSSTGVGTTGKIGIGDVTDPQAKLHIRADVLEDAAIMLQPTSSNYLAKIFLGDNNHSISANANSNLTFFTGNGNHFAFLNGNAGFGTSEPAAKVQIKDGDIFIEDINRGIVMKSPDGNCWRGTMNNQGVMEFAQIDCNTLLSGTTEKTPNPASAIKIYPNPAGNQVFISCNTNFNTLKLEITNMNGQLISAHKLSNSESFIDLSAYQPGAYIFRLTDENGKQVAAQKVIKE